MNTLANVSCGKKPCAEATRTNESGRGKEDRVNLDEEMHQKCEGASGESSHSFMLRQKKRGSEVERTGTLLAGAQHKHWCASAGLRRPAGASACSGHGDKDALMRAKLPPAHLPAGVLDDAAAAAAVCSGKDGAEGRINTGRLANSDPTPEEKMHNVGEKLRVSLVSEFTPWSGVNSDAVQRRHTESQTRRRAAIGSHK